MIEVKAFDLNDLNFKWKELLQGSKITIGSLSRTKIGDEYIYTCLTHDGHYDFSDLEDAEEFHLKSSMSNTTAL